MSAPRQADRPAGSPELELRSLGLRCNVEARGNLAIVTPAPGERALEDAAIRSAALAALRRHGFTHAAIEVLDDRAPAPEPRAPRA